jgi:hypothetical protein
MATLAIATSTKGREEMGDRWTQLNTAAVAVTPVLLMAVAVAMLTGSAFGWNPAWPVPDLSRHSLAEAVARRNRPMVLTKVWNGADINGRYRVAAYELPDTHGTVSATPLEAAIATREVWMVQFILDNGGLVQASDRPALVCLARKYDAKDSAELLAQGLPIDCTGVKLPW